MLPFTLRKFVGCAPQLRKEELARTGNWQLATADSRQTINEEISSGTFNDALTGLLGTFNNALTGSLTKILQIKK
jgi:hypothetical protein